MRENQRRSEVIELSNYRSKAIKAAKRPEKPSFPPEKLLDEITYHILMAARAIAAHTNK